MSTPPSGFGRRGTPPQAPKKDAPQTVEPRVRLQTDESTLRLQRDALDLDTKGQVLASVGLAIVFLAMMFWPDVPYDPTLSGTLIYLPDILAADLDYAGLSTSGVDLFNGRLHGPHKIFLELLLVFLGCVAVFRGRWIVAAAVAGIFLFPWELIGQEPPARMFLILGLLFAVPVRLLNVRLVSKLAIAFAVFLVLPFVLAMLPRVEVPRLFEASYTPYHAVSLSKINGEFDRQARWGWFLEGKYHADDAPAVAGARAFGAAQYAYKSEDPEAALLALQRLSDLDVPLNKFESDLAERIERYALAHGAAGPVVKTDVRWNARIKFWIASVILLLGLLVALTGPISNSLRNSMQARADRIELARQKLNAAGPASAQAATGAAGAGAQSIVAADAGVALDLLQHRLSGFVVAAACVLGLALMTVLGWLLFYLPPAGANTAFAQVALPGDVARFGTKVGFFPISGLGGWLPPMPTSNFGYGIVLAVTIFLFVRNRTTLALTFLLLSVVVTRLAFPVLAPGPQYEVSAGDIAEDHRELLERKLRLPEDEQSSAMQLLNHNHTALVMAQIAYLEDRPGDSAGFLKEIGDAEFEMPYQNQRLVVVREWVNARGFEVPVPQDMGIGAMRPHISRIVSASLGVVSVLLLLAGGGLSVVCFVLYRRRLSLQSLLSDAQQPVAARTARSAVRV